MDGEDARQAFFDTCARRSEAGAYRVDLWRAEEFSRSLLLEEYLDYPNDTQVLFYQQQQQQQH